MDTINKDFNNKTRLKYMKMTQETKDILKNFRGKKIRCKKCRTVKRYTNPMEKCSVCKETFCYDHLKTRIEKKGVINYCEEHYPS